MREFVLVIANPPYIELMVRSMRRTNAQRAIEKAQPDRLGGADKCMEIIRLSG